MSDKIWFDPTSDKWALSDGEHYLEVPHWAREIIVNEFERETRQLKTENTELREQLAKARDPQRIGGTADPESFVYAIEQLREFRWQHATNDEEAIPYINNVADAHERENAKLRDERDGWKKLCVDQEVMHFRREETLDNENTKLRELLADTLMQPRDYCQKYDIEYDSWDSVNDHLDARMRELGVEVDK